VGIAAMVECGQIDVIWNESLAETFFAAVLLSLSIWLDFLVLQEQRPDSRFSNELATCEFGKVVFVWTWIVFDRWCSASAAVIWMSSISALLWPWLLLGRCSGWLQD